MLRFAALLLTCLLWASSAWAAATAALLTSGNGTMTPATTASVTPASNKLVLVSVSLACDVSCGANVLALSGNGLTYVRVLEEEHGTRRTVGLFRALGASPSSGAISISYSGAATPQNAAWVVTEITNPDTTGTNGSGAVGTPTGGHDNVGTGTATITITGTPAAGDITFATIGMSDGVSITEEGGWTNLANPSSADAEGDTMWSSGQDLTPTWTVTNLESWAAVGVIIKASVSSVSTEFMQRRRGQ